jgi:predicted O-linked N-acetylglucosamine transferase (SPINDLY family)
MPLSDQAALDLAVTHRTAGRLAEAEALFRQVLASHPQNADLLEALGNLVHQAGRSEEAVRLLSDATARAPSDPTILNSLGLVQMDLARYDEAIATFQAAIALAPALPPLHFNLALACQESRRLDRAIAAYRAALHLRPAHADSWLSLGAALVEQGEIDEAVAAYRSGLQIAPRHAHVYNNLGNALKERGEVEAAVACFQQSLFLQSDSAVHSNLILTSYYLPEESETRIVALHRSWCQHHGSGARGAPEPPPHEKAPHRVLRLGYVSPDLRDHAVGRTLLPVFESHDPEHFELVCYHGTRRSDAFTARFRARADRWRTTARWSEERLASEIRADGIHILVDLALHTAGSRLGAFARRAAPVQVAWLGYPGSTGLPEMDYAITDPSLSRPDVTATYYTEHPVPLPHAWCVFQPPAQPIEVNALPAVGTGVVTFGSLNNFCKINDRVLETWARILGAVTDSRLAILGQKGSHRERVLRFFASRAIAPERIQWLDFQPAGDGDLHAAGGATHYLHRYHAIDIALDPFPYTGMTSTFEALWMGVPVVTLCGRLPVARAGLSILTQAGLPELVAADVDGYMRIAVDLALDLPRLGTLRRELRSRLAASPLLDVPRFTRHLESAFLGMWRRWCAGLPPGELLPIPGD